jgi:hypothetical protein
MRASQCNADCVPSFVIHPLNIAAIARCDCTGLGTLSRAFHDRFGFDRTVSIGRHSGEQFHHWYGNNRPAPEGITPELAEWLLDGADAVMTFETWYGAEVPMLARKRGIRTVLVAMYECTPMGGVGLGLTDLVVCPHELCLREMQITPGCGTARKLLLPMPIDTVRIRYRQRHRARIFLHLAGRMTNGDRNNTRAVLEAWQFVKSDARLLVRTLDPLVADFVRSQAGDDERVSVAPTPTRSVSEANSLPLLAHASGSCGAPRHAGENYWDGWEEGDVLLYPHKWDGCSLPMHEALAAGMPVMTTRFWPFTAMGVMPPRRGPPIEPELLARYQSDQPGWLPPTSRKLAIEPTGMRRVVISRPIIAFETSPCAIAAAVDTLFHADISAASFEGRAFAESRSFERFAPLWRTELMCQT